MTNHHNGNLSTFIAHARTKGMDHGTIRALLLASGWRERDVIEALAEEGLDMPIPAPPDTGGPRDAFFHLLTSVSLYGGFFSIVSLFFDLFNRLFPDTELERYIPDAGSIRWYMATIIITAPLYFLLMRALNRDMAKNPEKAGSAIRRWLTYLTLFLASMTMVGNLITLVFYTLDGDLTLRFLCKVATLFALSGLVFAYYFAALRRPATDRSLQIPFRIVGIAVVLLALVAGFWVAGSPGARRQERLDEQRVMDLQAITSAIDMHVRDGRWDVPLSELPIKPLPVALLDLVDGGRILETQTMDPETKLPYEYSVLTPATYELCATFDLAGANQYQPAWDHDAGRSCFSFNVQSDPQVPVKRP